jgi:DNA polymerase III delta prime subunit
MWDRLTNISANESPKIIIYGPPGIGKTTLASEFPSPVFIQIEDGIPSGMSISSFGLLETYEEVIEAMRSLCKEDHQFQTLIIDSLDKMEALLAESISRKNGWQNISTPKYGAGYIACDIEWKKFLNALDVLKSRKNMTIVAICHSSIERFDDPSIESYSQYDLNLHKRSKPIICAEFDAILFLKQDVQLKEDQAGFSKRSIAEGLNRIIFCEGRPSFIAKNRYNMPYKIKYNKGKGYEELSKYFPKKKIFENKPINNSKDNEDDEEENGDEGIVL